MDTVKGFTFSVGFSTAIILYLTNIVSGRDCEIDANKGWFDPDNVYQCPSDQTCCVESGKASCCGDKGLASETLDQIKLWGSVFGVTLVIAILVCCCRKDNNCCDGEATCCYYLTCQCCRGGKRNGDIEYQKFPPPSPNDSTTSSKKRYFHDSPKTLGADDPNAKIHIDPIPPQILQKAPHINPPPGAMPPKAPQLPPPPGAQLLEAAKLASPPLIQVD